MNEIIATYTLQFATVRYFAGSDDDVALTLVGDQLVAAGWELDKTGTNVVSENSNQYYQYWTRAGAPDIFNPDPVDNVTWVDATPVIA